MFPKCESEGLVWVFSDKVGWLFMGRRPRRYGDSANMSSLGLGLASNPLPLYARSGDVMFVLKLLEMQRVVTDQ
jgi:hypothetical protein